MTASSVSRAGTALITYGPAIDQVNIFGGSGSNTYNISGTETFFATTLNTGDGTDTVNVQATSGPLTVHGHGGGGNDVINLGNAGHLGGVAAPITIDNGPSFFNVNIDDSADSTDHLNVDLGLTAMGGSLYGIVTGLSGGAISYKNDDTRAVTVKTGTGTEVVQVEAAGVLGFNPANLTTVEGNSSNTTVNVGSGNSLAAISGALRITNPPHFSHVNINDSADSTSHPNAALTATSLTGLSSGAITFGGDDLASLIINGGGGSNTYNIVNTQASGALGGNLTTLNTGAGADTVNVQGATGALAINSASGSGADAINLGDAANTLGSIFAPVSVNAAATDTLTFNDQGTAADRAYMVGVASVSWSSGPGVNYTGIGSLTVNGGSGNDSYNLTGTSATVALTVIGGSGNNELIGSDAGNFWSLAGTNAGSLTGPAYASSASFSNIPNLTAGNGGDTFQFADGAAITGNLTGGGSDALDYSQYTTSVVVDLQSTVAGIDTGVGGVVSGIKSVTGGSGVPAGPGVYNILIGNGGNVLTGGDGRRNLLIAGASASTLIGGNDDDILIGGTTSYDTEPGLVSLQAIMAYWSSTADDYATRVANLLSGNGVPLLDASMVTSNGGGNTMMGNHGGAGEMNLFYGSATDTTDQNPGIGEEFISC